MICILYVTIRWDLVEIYGPRGVLGVGEVERISSKML
jgi:hypothetical protein